MPSVGAMGIVLYEMNANLAQNRGRPASSREQIQAVELRMSFLRTLGDFNTQGQEL